MCGFVISLWLVYCCLRREYCNGVKCFCSECLSLYVMTDSFVCDTRPLFYMNSSAGDGEVENFVAPIILRPKRYLETGLVDVKESIGNAKNSVCFGGRK